MGKEIIEQVKEAEMQIEQLVTNLNMHKAELQDELVLAKEAYEAQLEEELIAHKTALIQANSEQLARQKQQVEASVSAYRTHITAVYDTKKETLVQKGIEEVMNAYGNSNHEAADHSM